MMRCFCSFFLQCKIRASRHKRLEVNCGCTASMGDFPLFCQESRLSVEENGTTSVESVETWIWTTFSLLYLGRICWAHVLLCSNALLHICTVKDVHTWELPSTTSVPQLTAEQLHLNRWWGALHSWPWTEWSDVMYLPIRCRSYSQQRPCEYQTNRRMGTAFQD